MDLELAGKVALVAGASRGIGRAIAEGLAAEGARLLIAARGAGRGWWSVEGDSLMSDAATGPGFIVWCSQNPAYSSIIARNTASGGIPTPLALS